MKAWIEGPKRTGPWKVRWRELSDGKWTKKASRSFLDKASAEAERDAVDLRLANAEALRPNPRDALMSMSTVLARWRASALSGGSVREPYADEVVGILTALCERQGWKYTNQITSSAIEQWRSGKDRGHTKPTAMLKAMLRWARANLRQPIDPQALELPVRRPMPRPPPDLLTQEQVAAILARAYTFGEAIGAAIEHLSLFGCRPVDVCRMNVADWNRRTRTLTLRDTKSGTRPSHPITGPFDSHAKRLDRLTAGRGLAEPLFVSPTGSRWNVDAKSCARQLVDWYMIHITDHVPGLLRSQRGIQCLKDYAITMLDTVDVDDRTKALFTGHKTLGVFARYKTTNRDRAEAALEKLGTLTAPTGAKLGALPTSGAKTGGNPSNPKKPENQETTAKSTDTNTKPRQPTRRNTA